MKIVSVISVIAVIAGIVIYSNSNNKSRQQTSVDTTRVITSFYPLYDFARQVGGNKISVTNITPPGAEPHDYEPNPQELAKATQASLFVYAGGEDFEPWSEKFVSENSVVSLKVDAVTVSESAKNFDVDNGLDAGLQLIADDPHFWLDPMLSWLAVQNISNKLAEVDPSNAAYYQSQAAAYQSLLTQLDSEFQAGLKNCQSRTIVTAHEAFGYLGKRYNLDVIPIAGISPEEEPSAAALATLTKIIKDKQVTTIFFETLTSPQLANTLATETGAKTAVLDPIEGISNEDQTKGKDYIAVQRENLAALRTALSCR